MYIELKDYKTGMNQPGSGAVFASNGCTKQSGLKTMTDPSQEQSAILWNRAEFSTVVKACRKDRSSCMFRRTVYADKCNVYNLLCSYAQLSKFVCTNQKSLRVYWAILIMMQYKGIQNCAYFETSYSFVWYSMHHYRLLTSPGWCRLKSTPYANSLWWSMVCNSAPWTVHSLEGFTKYNQLQYIDKVCKK